MKVVQFIPDFDLGGVQKAGVVLAKFLHRTGHPSLVLGRRVGPRQAELTAAGVRSVAAAEPAEWRRALEDFAPDVVHVHGEGYDDPFVAAAVEAAEGRPVVLTPVFGRAPVDREILHRVTTCCVGLYTHHRLCRWLGLGVAEAIGAGIVFAELTPFEGPERKSDAPGELVAREPATVVFGRVGRAHFGKWHPRTAELVSRVLGEVPSATWLSVGWPAEMELAEMERRWGARFVNFPETADFGFIRRTFGEMDLHFFASRYGECFSSTICEAASVGTPTIAVVHPFNDAGEVEQVVDGETGWLVRTPDELAGRTGELLRQRHVLAELRGHTCAYARAHWHVEVVGPRVLQIYEATVQKRLTTLGASPDFARALDFRARYRQTLTWAMGPRPLGVLAFSLYHSGSLWRLVRLLRKLLRKMWKPHA